MKNAILKVFLGVFIVLNVAFFHDIMDFFYILSDIVWENVKFDLVAVILCIIFVGLMIGFIVCLCMHRDRNEIVTTVEFESPKDMNPLEVGFLVDGKIDSEDLSSLLVYWANLKYIEIINEKDNQKIKKIVEKLPKESKNYEKLMFNKIFEKNSEISVNRISSRFDNNDTINIITKEVENENAKKYFDKNILQCRQLFILFFAVLFYFSVMYFRLEYFADYVPIIESFAVASTGLYILVADWVLNYYDYRHKNNSYKGRTASLVVLILLITIMIGLSCYFFMTDLYQVFILIGFLVGLLIVALFSRKFQIYKDEGIVKLGKILGFRDFIQTTEADRIKMLADENPNIYYDILPYAFVLGVSDQWIKKLDVIKTNYPKEIGENVYRNVVLYSWLYNNSKMSLVRTIRTANIANSIFQNSISLGSNHGSGKNVGGSNFGGRRRR